MSNEVSSDDDLLDYQKIESNTSFKLLVRKRAILSWTLSAIMLGSYCIFILLLAYAPNFIGSPIVKGGTVTYGIPIGIGLIILAFVLSGIYVYKANGEFDRLNAEVIFALKDRQETK